MGQIVAAIGMSHAPGLRAWPEAVTPHQLSVIENAYRALAERLATVRPDLLVLIGPEHWANFSLANMPSFCVGVASDYRGPLEPWLRLPDAHVAGSATDGRLVVEQAFDDGVDVSYSHDLVFDHAFMVPLSYLTPSYEVPVVPIIENCLVEPMPHPRRCYELGLSLAQAIARMDKRVAVVATGGLSHWPGELRHGEVNVEFDREVLSLVESGQGAKLAGFSHADLAAGGSGAHEIRAWISMLATVPHARFNALFYEPVPPLATGCAAVAYFPEPL